MTDFSFDETNPRPSHNSGGGSGVVFSGGWYDETGRRVDPSIDPRRFFIDVDMSEYSKPAINQSGGKRFTTAKISKVNHSITQGEKCNPSREFAITRWKSKGSMAYQFKVLACRPYEKSGLNLTVSRKWGFCKLRIYRMDFQFSW